MMAQANVGIAMGTGTDVDSKSGSVTLVKGDLRGIAKAILLTHALFDVCQVVLSAAPPKCSI